MKIDIDNNEVAIAVQNRLPTRIKSLIVALVALGNEDKIFTLNYVKSRFLEKEQRAKMKAKPAKYSRGLALVDNLTHTALASHSLNCTNCGHNSHTAPRCWGKDVVERCFQPNVSTNRAGPAIVNL